MRVRDIGDSMMEVELRCRDAEAAHRIGLRNDSTPPIGYKLISSVVRRRGQSGTRRNLSMRFLYAPQRPTDRELTPDEFKPLFEFDEQMA